jgi:uncharacterized coiled-coil DUF342 family protein
MCADLCIHDKNDGNPHAHIMLTMRPITPDGKWGGKQKKEYILDGNGNKIYGTKKRQYKCRSVPSTDWNNRDNADKWRKAWEGMANAELERLGFDSRIDRRTYEEQDVEQVPTVHLGVAAMQMERRGIRTERGDMNRAIEITNREIRQLRARINKLEAWIAEESLNPEQPKLADVISNILSSNNDDSQYRRIANLQAAAQALIFIRQNDIRDFADLEKKVREMNSELRGVRENLKKVNRRIDTLNEHIRHGENYKKYRGINAHYEKLYAQYTALKKTPGFMSEHKAQKALDTANDYFEANRMELTLYNAAEKYLRGVLQERFDPKKLPPITKWREELSAKMAEKNALHREYSKIKDKTANAEKIQRSVRDILSAGEPERARQKSRGLEL